MKIYTYKLAARVLALYGLKNKIKPVDYFQDKTGFAINKNKTLECFELLDPVLGVFTSENDPIVPLKETRSC